MLVTGFSIIVISCDRLLIIRFPSFYKTDIQIMLSIIMIIVMWIAAIAISAPIFVWKVYRRYHYKDWLSESCANSPEIKSHQYYLFIIVFVIYIPILITAATYIVILCKLQKYNSMLEYAHSKIINRRNKVPEDFIIELDVLCILNIHSICHFTGLEDVLHHHDDLFLERVTFQHFTFDSKSQH